MAPTLGPVPSGTVAGRLLDALAEAGVDYIFGNPGTTELPLLAELAARSTPRYVLALHDSVAVGMAHGFAQASGRLGVVNLHAAPGLANAMGNLYNAFRSGVPLLVTAGQVASSLALYDPPLSGDLVAMARPVTKWACELRKAEELVPALRKAIHAALTPPTGPVFLGIPVDLLEEPAAPEPLDLPELLEPVAPDAGAMEPVARELALAQAPLLVVGERAASPELVPLLVALAEALGMPVRAERIPPRLAFPTDHPLWAGPLPAAGKALGKLLTAHDLLLVVGASRLAPVLRAPEWEGVRAVRQVRLEPSGGHLLEGMPPHLAVVGPLAVTLGGLLEAVRDLTRADAALAQRLAGRRSRQEAELRAQRMKQSAGQPATSMPASAARAPAQGLTAAKVAEVLDHILPPGAIVVEEALTSTRALLARRAFRDPATYYGIKGTALGWGLPAAVGVRLARPDRPVVAFVGDGSSLYAFQALWTAAHLGINLPVILLRNGGYRILREGFRPEVMKEAGEEGWPQAGLLAMRLGPPEPDFVALAHGLGVPARRVAAEAELREALPWALEAAGPAVLEVSIDP